mmetsp:Transcript_36216/g.86285  ORF Transcript_36216/g.86285 Transcript_36216/m.86285 type:complete len:221 (-) Transcript_36216:1190-1852(-)
MSAESVFNAISLDLKWTAIKLHPCEKWVGTTCVDVQVRVIISDVVDVVDRYLGSKTRLAIAVARRWLPYFKETCDGVLVHARRTRRVGTRASLGPAILVDHFIDITGKVIDVQIIGDSCIAFRLLPTVHAFDCDTVQPALLFAKVHSNLKQIEVRYAQTEVERGGSRVSIPDEDALFTFAISTHAFRVRRFLYFSTANHRAFHVVDESAHSIHSARQEIE